MHTKFLLLGAATLALAGGATLVAPFSQSGPDGAFLDPKLLNRSLCTSADPARSRRAAFIRLGQAVAQTPDLVAAAGAVAPSSLALMSYAVSTDVPEAQDAFNRGLAYTFNFNHGAAINAFRAAQAADPDCAMCYWGEAYAFGPNINAMQMDDAAVEAAWSALQKAMARTAGASETEAALIRALSARYSPTPLPDRSHLDIAYADAMDPVARQFPEDDLVAVLAAEANMDTQPWAYWDATGRMPVGRTARTIELIETVIARRPDYSPAIHLYIHSTEASTDPYRAAAHAERMAELTPELGHLTHMPSHTWVVIGRWKESLEANLQAIAADAAFIDANETSPLYEYGYYTHNLHFAVTSGQMGGDGATALEMSRRLDAKLPIAFAAEQAWVQPIKAAPYHAMVQFAPPEDILALPDPGDALPFLKANWHYARGEAQARLGALDEAKAEVAAIAAMQADTSNGLPEAEAAGLPVTAILDTARLTVLARIAAAEGDFGKAVALMEEAVAAQDSMPYFEPPYWYYPARQTLGAMVLRGGDPERAERIFLDTLVKSPNNAYAYYGLAEAFGAQGDRRGKRLARSLYKEAWLGGRGTSPSLDRL